MTALSKNTPKTRIMKKILVVVALLFTGLFPFLSTRPNFNSQMKYEDNRLLERERNIKYRLQKEKSSIEFNDTHKTTTSDVSPVQVKIKYSSRHRKGKIVYSKK